MENFFLEDKFYRDLSELADNFSEEDIEEMADDTEWTAEGSDLEPIFELSTEFILNVIGDYFEDRFPENSEAIEKQIEAAINSAIDFEKLNNSLPKLYYANCEMFQITKADLVRLLNNKNTQ
jgi:hypothetical protein